MTARTTRRNAATPGAARLAGRVARILVVLMLVLLGQLSPAGSGVATAGGFDCKDVPVPELPRDAFPAKIDGSAADRPPPTNANPTGYQSYGWAGLDWDTYDLGCGSDLVRAPQVAADTNIGNEFLTVGKSLAAAAFWLDDQTKTTQEAQQAGISPALQQFDTIVESVSHATSGVYGLWLGIALTAAATVMLWNALRANAAGVTRAAAVAAAGLALGALMIGAPAKAIQVADDTFGSVITQTQTQMFSLAFGGKNATLGAGDYDPRNVLMDRIFLDDWRQGWFGANYDDSSNQLGPKLRQALAFSYAEQQQIAKDPSAQDRLTKEKERIFRDEIVTPLESHNLSYFVFQGKTSHRIGIGFMALLKLGMPSILWIGASILKLTALLAIRFAILLAPVWVPLSIAHGGWLMRVCRMLASAYLWGVAGAVIVALYLMALVQLYVVDNTADGGTIDGSWRLWFMLLLTCVFWFIMRPFKRISQTLTQNQAGVLNQSARRIGRTLRPYPRPWGTRGPGPAKTDPLPDRPAPAQSTEAESSSRPEGRSLDQRRRANVDRTRAQLDLARRRRDAGRAGSSRRELENGPRTTRADRANTADPEAGQATPAGTAAQRPEQRSSPRGPERRMPPRPVAVGARWDGGDRSIIAPTRVYTSRRNSTTTGSRRIPYSPRRPERGRTDRYT